MAHKHKDSRKGVSHHLPHRTRYRLPKNNRTKDVAKKIRDRVGNVPGVTSVDVNERTGSILISHDEEPGILSSLDEAMHSVAEDLFEEILETEGDAFLPGISIFARLVAKRAKHADSYIADKTNNYLNLKSLFPAALFGAGLYKASRSKGLLENVPAFVLFYYAFDSYMKLHPTAPAQVETGQTEAEGVGNGAPRRLTVKAQ